MACADALVPMQAACGDLLAVLGMQANVDAAVATCPSPIPCSNSPEFGAAASSVTAACCDGDFPCVSGLPTACNGACASVLPPFYTACREMLGNIGMQASVEAALGTCHEGGGGH